MDAIDRNDPYQLPNPNQLDHVLPDTLYGVAQGPPPSQAQDTYYYFRVAGMCLGVLIVLSGAYFAGASFTLLRGILEEPERLNAYLDEWYIPPQEKAAVPDPVVDKPVSETLPVAATETPVAEPPAPANPPAAPEALPNAPRAEPSAPVAETTATPNAGVQANEKPLPPHLKRLAERKSREVPKNDKPASDVIGKITDAFTRGGLPRLAGALILLLLASMLLRIPFGLVKAGIELIRAMLPDRAKSVP